MVVSVFHIFFVVILMLIYGAVGYRPFSEQKKLLNYWRVDPKEDRFGPIVTSRIDSSCEPQINSEPRWYG